LTPTAFTRKKSDRENGKGAFKARFQVLASERASSVLTRSTAGEAACV
jgi:hypothetical protein